MIGDQGKYAIVSDGTLEDRVRQIAERERAHESTLKITCGSCDWTLEGPTEHVLAERQAHMRKAHPDVKLGRGKTGKLKLRADQAQRGRESATRVTLEAAEARKVGSGSPGVARSTHTRHSTIQGIQQLAHELGRTPSYDEALTDKRLPGITVLNRLFGPSAYSQAIAAAGLEPATRGRKAA